MITLALNRIVVSLAAVLAFSSLAVAQQTTTPSPAPAPATAPTKPKPAKPAAKPSASKPAPQAVARFGAEPTLLGQYGEWGAYAAVSGGNKICFAGAKPSGSQTTPPNKPRDPVFFFVASRPGENVRNEVSVIIGYAFKPATDAAVEIGPAKFAMYTQNDGAWIKNAAEETRLVETMRKGTDLVVTGTSSRGTQSADRYSLKGLSQALDRVAQECK
jgi:Invasion associated locus B (IalB) protein